jgi:hypothetical protein
MRGGTLAAVLTACLLASSTAALPAQQAKSQARRFDFRIANGKLLDDPKLIRVLRGDTVVIGWRADRQATVHLHGYDIETTVMPERMSEMSFAATATGRFPIELHAVESTKSRHSVLIYLEVHPR